MRAPRLALWSALHLFAAALLGCEPPVRNGAAVRSTYSRELPPQAPAELRARTRAAQASLARWKTRAASDLSLLLRDSEDKLVLSLANAGAGGDARVVRATEQLSLAADRIAGATAPLDEQAAAEVRGLLSTSRASSVAARGADPTAASPTSSLKALRKQQAAERQYEY